MNGNRCEHYSTLPRFYMQPSSHKKRPFILIDAIEKLEKIYFKPKDFFRKFSLPKNRLKRSERREAIICLLQFMVHYAELHTLRVVKNDVTFDNFSLQEICKNTLLSFSRIKRAIADLVKVGYIKLIKQFKKEDGTHKGRPSIREILPLFFIDLGIDMSQLNFSRAWKQKKIDKNLSKKNLSFLSQLIKTITFKKTRIPLQSQISNALSLYRSNPSKSPSHYFKQLTQKKE